MPQGFFEFTGKLDPPISPIQRLLVLHFMSFKWAEDPPYMSFVTLGKHLGMTPKMVSRHASKLRKSGYLRIEDPRGPVVQVSSRLTF